MPLQSAILYLFVQKYTRYEENTGKNGLKYIFYIKK